MTAEQEKFVQSHQSPSNKSSLPETPQSSTGEVSGKDRIERIRDLNDRLRQQGRGGMIHMTHGVAALGLAKDIFKEIAEFSAFNPDNDPWGEHDCASPTVRGHRIIWKIDYYDRTRTYHSPDPADPKVTVRVMTVMLAEEY